MIKRVIHFNSNMTDFYYTIIYGRKTENRKQGTGLYELASLWLSHEI